MCYCCLNVIPNTQGHHHPDRIPPFFVPTHIGIVPFSVFSARFDMFCLHVYCAHSTIHTKRDSYLSRANCSFQFQLHYRIILLNQHQIMFPSLAALYRTPRTEVRDCTKASAAPPPAQRGRAGGAMNVVTGYWPSRRPELLSKIIVKAGVGWTPTEGCSDAHKLLTHHNNT